MSVPGQPGSRPGGLGGLGGMTSPSGGSAAPMNSVASTFLNTVKAGGLTNPYGLAAVAATGKHESGWDPAKTARVWNDPSESGQAGSAGGLLSWRAERLNNMQRFVQQAGGDPVSAQAKFFLQENPGLIQQLNQAKSPEEAAQLMAGAWKFAGYDRPGQGEAANRIATTRAMLGRIGGGGQADGQPTGAGATLSGMGTDPRTVAIVSAAQKYLPQGYTIEQISGHRPGDTGFHGEAKGKSAIDVRILDPEGKPVGGDRGHMGEDPTGLYTRLARGAYTELLATNPELKGQFAWGGAFGTQKGTGAGPRDLMHFDLGGERGRYTQYRLSNLGPLDGGGVPRQGMAMGQPRPIQLASADPTAAPVPPGLSPTGAPTVLPGPVPRAPVAAPAPAQAQAEDTLDPASAAILTRFVRNRNDPAAYEAAKPILTKLGEPGPLLERWGPLKDQGMGPEAIIAALQQPPGQQPQGAPLGAPLGQSGAPLDQVASSGSRMPRVPLPDSTIPTAPATPAAPPAGTAPATPDAGSATPPAAKGTNKTKAWAQQQFQVGMNILAASNGDPVLMKQGEIMIQRAAKYGDPSDTAKRVGEAGLTGTPVGRAIIAGFPNHTIEKLMEQQIPGYESPGTLEQKKFRSAEDERSWQHQRLEREFGASEYDKYFRRNLDTSKFQSEAEEKAYRRGLSERQYGLDERKFGQTVEHNQQTLEEQRAGRQQQRDIATESHTIQQQTEAERTGAALNAPSRAANVQTGLAEKQRQIAAEARARDTEAARAKYSAEATSGAQAAESLIAPVKQAQEALEKVVEMGGYGPRAAGPISRAVNPWVPDIPGLKPGHAAEIERQNFDQAMKTIGAAKAAIINHAQGGGNMSGTEQVLARADLATLTSADPSIARKALQKLNDDIAVALKRDKQLGLYGGEQQQTPANQQQPASQPAAAPALRDGATAVNPRTGERLMLRNGQWVPAGGAR